MKKKFCSRCNKIINYNDTCSCYSLKERKISEKQKQSDSRLRSRRWAKLRESILKRDKYLCQRCFIKYGIINNDDLTIHHIKSRDKHPELFYERSNLITICRICNSQLEAKHFDHQLDFIPDKTLLEEDDFIL